MHEVYYDGDKPFTMFQSVPIDLEIEDVFIDSYKGRKSNDFTDAFFGIWNVNCTMGHNMNNDGCLVFPQLNLGPSKLPTQFASEGFCLQDF